MRRDLIIALSFANFCFLKAWRSFLDPAASHFYYQWTEFYGWTELAALTLNILLLAALVFAATRALRRVRQPFVVAAARWLFVLAALVAFNMVRVQWPALYVSNLAAKLGRGATLALCAAVAVAALLAALRLGARRASRALAVGLLIMSPLVAVLYAQAAWLTLKYAGQFRDRTPAPAHARPPSNARGPRVVWLLFDELDYRLAFPERPAGVALPELDRLRAESLFAERAFPPSGKTLTSVPALITGRLVARARRVSPRELEVTFDGENTSAPLSGQPNIFSRARAAGMNAAVLGWFHPYCRLVGDDLASCSAVGGDWKFPPQEFGLAHVMFEQWRDLLTAAPLGRHLWTRLKIDTPKSRSLKRYRSYQETRIAEIRHLVGGAERAAADRDTDLLMVHFPFPHFPPVYDRARGELSVASGGYLDNLALTDRAVGQLRRAMEQAGVWDETAVLVTSDHWFREWGNLFTSEEDRRLAAAGASDFRVPFVLKLPGQREGRVYAPEFNTVLTHDLLLDILAGRLRTAEEAARWLDARRGVGPSPYYQKDLE